MCKNTMKIQTINLIIMPQWGIIQSRGRGKAQNQTARERRKSMEGMTDSQVKLLLEFIIATMKGSENLEDAIRKVEEIKENSLGK